MIQLVEKHVKKFSDKPFVLEKLPSHASERAYVRVRFNDGTAILATKASSKNEYSSYLYLADAMREQKIPHPRIITYYTPELLYFQEFIEGGDLATKLCNSDYGEKIGHLYAAIDSLLAFHGMKCVKYAFAYPQSLMEPIERLRYGLELLGIHDVPFRTSLSTSRDEELFDIKAKKLLKKTAYSDTGLIHRDFNPRNLLYDPCCGYTIIDFQGFRKGPQTYDLASLLQDTQLISDELREAALEYYIHKKNIGKGMRKDFIRHFNAMMLVRDIEACGIVSMLVSKQAHPHFLQVYDMYKQKARFAVRLLELI